MTFPVLFKITPGPFGLDLSDRSIKIAQLSRRRGTFFLENFGEAIFEEGLVENGKILARDMLAARVRSAVQAIPLTSSYAACSLPEQETYLRVIQLPRMKPEELREAVQWEVEQNIPIHLSEAYFDWEVVPSLNNNESKKGGVDHFDILVSAAPRALVDSYVELFEQAGLKVFALEPESVALARSLIPKNSYQPPLLIVDFGRTRIRFIIYAGGSIRFTSFVHTPDTSFLDIIIRTLGVDVKEANRLLEEVGLDEEQDKRVYEALIPALTDYQQQIQKYMNFFATLEPHVHGNVPGISKIILSGGGSWLKGIEKYFTTTLGIPVEVGNPWVNILQTPLRETPELPFKDSIRYATSLGLVLSGQNNMH